MSREVSIGSAQRGELKLDADVVVSNAVAAATYRYLLGDVARLPLVSKRDIQEHARDMIRDDRRHADLVANRTGGATGERLTPPPDRGDLWPEDLDQVVVAYALAISLGAGRFFAAVAASVKASASGPSITTPVLSTRTLVPVP